MQKGNFGRKDMDAKTQNERQETLKAVLHYFYQDNTRSGAHCRYDLKYHIVWIPKYRRKILTEKIAERLKQILPQIAKDYQFKIIAMEVMPDHVHLLIEASPKYAPSKIVGYLKGISSKMLRKEFLEEIKKHIWKENTLWARGYYIAMLADGLTTDIVQEYINNQKVEEVSISEKKLVQASLF
jgi:putative transposase